MQSPKFVTDLLETYDSDLRPVAEYEIASALIGALRHHKPLPPADEEGFCAEFWAFCFRLAEKDKPTPWGTDFKPIHVESREDGSTTFTPDMQKSGLMLVEHWSKRAGEAVHPVLKARYADLVWDLARPATGKRADIKYARLAIDSYIEANDSKLYKDETQGIRYATRALNLALGVNDNGRIAAAREAMFRLFDRVATPRLPGTWIFLFDSLHANRSAGLTDEQQAKLIESLEAILTRCTTPGADFSLFAAELAVERLERYFKGLQKPVEVYRVTRVFGGAVESFCITARASLALVWLQILLRMYRENGMRVDMERAHRLLSERTKALPREMKEVSVAIRIDSKEREKFVAALTRGGLAASIHRVAAHFVPSIQEIKNFVEDAEEKFPLSSMFNVVAVSDAGIVAEAGSTSSDLDRRILDQMGRMVEIQSTFLVWTVDRLRELYSPSAHDIIEILYQSPVFDPERKELVRMGVGAYLAGDFITAVHLLLPQIEHVLLRLADSLGEVVRKPSRFNPNAMQWINLHDILQKEAVRKCLRQDLRLYLQMLLVDPIGYNVRNHVCHGHLNPADFSRELSDRVIHVVFALSLIREQKNGEQEPPKPTAE